jgi:hypothetical protein
VTSEERIQRIMGLTRFAASAVLDYKTRRQWTQIAANAPGVPDVYRKNMIKALEVQLSKLQEVLQELAKLVNQEYEELEDMAGPR